MLLINASHKQGHKYLKYGPETGGARGLIAHSALLNVMNDSSARYSVASLET